MQFDNSSFCVKCKENKPKSSFSKDKTKSNGLSSYCKGCASIVNKEYRRSKLGIITGLYKHHKYRCKLRGWVLDYNKDDLMNWCNDQSLFTKLYNDWIASGYSKNLSVSIDRINHKLPYSLSNIQLMTWESNNEKGYIENGHPVLQFDKEGNFIEEFTSINKAGIKNNTCPSSIRKVCIGERKSSGGYLWDYKN